MSWAIITHIDQGVAADRPPANLVPGRHYGWWSTDTKELSISDGSTWTTIGPTTGTGVTYGTPAIVLGTAAAAGSIDEAIRRDATILAFDATVPSTQAFGDSASAGSAAVAARRDHKHAMPAAPTAASVGALAATAAAGGALDGNFPNPGLAASVAGAGLAETSDVLSVNVDGSTIEIATDTLQVKDSGITSAKIANGTIVDADVNASAAIAYSKLALGSSIVSADIVDGTIVNADINASAAIAYSKLALGTSLVAGDLSAALSTSLQPWTIVTKASDTSRNTTTALAADPHLVDTLASGGIYEWEVLALYVSPVGAGTPDFKVGFGEDSTARGIGFVIGYYNTTEGPTGGIVNTCAPGAAAIASVGTATAVRLLHIRGWYVGNGASAGLWWSQVTSNGNDVTVKASSLFRYRRIV